MKDFWRDCNGISAVLFLLMTVQTVQSVIQRQWVWVAMLGGFALLNCWNMLPAYTKATIRARFKR